MATARRVAPAQPATPAASANPRVLELRKHLDQRLGGLLVDRMSWWTHWREIADYMIPRRYRWLVSPNQASRGTAINQRIIDNTATRAGRVLAAGMMSGITSPGRPWFRLTLDDADLAAFGPVKVWLDEVTRRMLTVYAESNFYTSLGTVYEDLAFFGTGNMIIYEDFEDVIRCYTSCAGEYFLANSDRLAVDTMYRQFVLSMKQIASKFGEENCSEDVRSAVRTGGAMLTRELMIAHAIEPNDDQLQGMKGFRGMPYREVYWEWGRSSDRVLSWRGFHECPFIAPRWSISGNDAYGRGPGMDALGDVKQLQVEQKRKAQAIDKIVNPPMVADIQLQNQPASILPGGVTYVASLANDKPGFRPAYEVKPQLGEMLEDIKEVQSRIDRTFFVDLFMMLAQMEGVQPRNDMEMMERKEEKMIQIGPVIERFENEALDPAIDRTFNIMLRAKLLPPIPRELKGQFIKAEYVSILSQAQKAAMTAGIERLMTFVGRVGSVDPSAFDNIDTDETIEEYADMIGVPAKLVRPIADVMKLRKQRADAQAQQAALAQTVAAVQGAKTLSETDVGGGKNALQQMVGEPG
jgi:hypothetical protein